MAQAKNETNGRCRIVLIGGRAVGRPPQPISTAGRSASGSSWCLKRRSCSSRVASPARPRSMRAAPPRTSWPP